MELYDPRMLFNCYSHARTKPIHPSYSYVSSRNVYTYYVEVEFKESQSALYPIRRQKDKTLGKK